MRLETGRPQLARESQYGTYLLFLSAIFQRAWCFPGPSPDLFLTTKFLEVPGLPSGFAGVGSPAWRGWVRLLPT